jgi:hypothetical protein
LLHVELENGLRQGVKKCLWRDPSWSSTKVMHDDESLSREVMVTCAFSGTVAPASRMLPIGDAWVLPEHKDSWLQALREGSLIERYGNDRFATPSLGIWALTQASFRMLREIWLPLLAIYFSFGLGVALLDGWLDQQLTLTGNDWRDLQRSIRLSWALDLILGCVGTLASLLLCAAAYDGQPIPLGQAFAGALRRWHRSVGASILMGILVAAGAICLVVPGVIMFVRSTFIQCLIADGETVGSTFSRLGPLIKGKFWRVVWTTSFMTLLVALPPFVGGVGVYLGAAMLLEIEETLWYVDALVIHLLGVGTVFLHPYIFILYRALRSQSKPSFDMTRR